MTTYDPTPTAYPFDANTTITGENIEDLLVSNTAPGQTLGVINGRLDQANAAAGLLVEPEHFQRGSWVRALSVAATLDLDYFKDSFADLLIFPTLPSPLAKPIPGLCSRFYMPWDGDVLLTWQVFWTNNVSSGAGLGYLSAVYLTFDDAYLEQTQREVRACVDTSGAREHLGYRKSRFYGGHHLQESVSRGWHTASIRGLSAGPTHTKFWGRGLQVVMLKDTPEAP